MKKKKGLGEVTEEDEIRKWIGGRWTLKTVKSAQKLLKKMAPFMKANPSNSAVKRISKLTR